jgi:signal transduction histidine kinase
MVIAIPVAVWLRSGESLSPAVVTALGAAVVVHLALVLVALRPIRDLETVASRVWRGDFGARVERSRVADHEVLRVGAMFNILLDALVADRARMRALATEVIAVGDRERAALARELHDSTAQNIAALLLQLSITAREAEDPLVAERLREARDAAEGILEEVRLLSHAVHPALLDDLGLASALRKLARDQSRGGVEVEVYADDGSSALPGNLAAVLYRVAQESLRNALRHASPRLIRIALHLQPSAVRLDVTDDGCGFDLDEAQQTRRGLGLLCMRERVALVDGTIDIRTVVGRGTTVSATVPLDAAPFTANWRSHDGPPDTGHRGR